MARLKVGTKRILATASQTKYYSKGGRNALAKRIKEGRKRLPPAFAGRSLEKSNYKYQGKKIQKSKGSTYPHSVFPQDI